MLTSAVQIENLVLLVAREIHRVAHPLDGIPWQIEGCLRDLREEGETTDESSPRSTGDTGYGRWRYRRPGPVFELRFLC